MRTIRCCAALLVVVLLASAIGAFAQGPPQVDPKNPVEVNGEQLFRGFYTWNSEVGSAVFGLTTFLYRYVCDNRIIWGATDVKELRIRVKTSYSASIVVPTPKLPEVDPGAE